VARFDAQRYVKDFETAWNRNDPEALLQHFAENVEFQDPLSPTPRRGREAARENMRAWFGAFTEMEIRLVESVVSDDRAALLYQCTARHTGELQIAPGERIPATNKRATVDLAEFDALDAQGRIVRTRAMFDSGRLMQQLGLMPAAGSTQQPPGRKPTSR